MPTPTPTPTLALPQLVNNNDAITSAVAATTRATLCISETPASGAYSHQRQQCSGWVRNDSHGPVTQLRRRPQNDSSPKCLDAPGCRDGIIYTEIGQPDRRSLFRRVLQNPGTVAFLVRQQDVLADSSLHGSSGVPDDTPIKLRRRSWVVGDQLRPDDPPFPRCSCRVIRVTDVAASDTDDRTLPINDRRNATHGTI